MKNEKNNKRKSTAINFRISGNVRGALEDRAVLAGKTVNGWARDEVIGRLDECHGMTPGERLMYVEINNLRHLVETMMLYGMNAENEDKFAEALTQSIENRETAARDYFSELAEVGMAKADATDVQ